MSAITIAPKNQITLDIVNEKGEKRGEIKFNPRDIRVYNAFMTMSKHIYNVSDKYDSVKDIAEIPEGKLDSVDEYKKVRDTFDKVADFTECAVKQIDEISKELDDVFGKGTSELILQGSYDFELLSEFIQGVAPYFKAAKKERLNKYLDDKNENDVM